MADPGNDVAAPAAPVRSVPWTAFQSVRIIGHDGTEARLVCLHCDPSQAVYLVRGPLSGVIKWAADHWQFLHQTQVAARE